MLRAMEDLPVLADRPVIDTPDPFAIGNRGIPVAC